MLFFLLAYYRPNSYLEALFCFENTEGYILVQQKQLLSDLYFCTDVVSMPGFCVCFRDGSFGQPALPHDIR